MKLIAIAAASAITSFVSVSAFADINLKLSHSFDTADPVQAAAETFARVAAEESDGEIKVTIYPAAQLGTYKQTQEGIQQGFVDIVVESIGTLSGFNEVAGVESMPYLFKGADHYSRVWNGEVGQEIKKILAEDANFYLTGHMYRGSRELTSSKKVESISDLEGLKIRVSPVKERLVTWNEFGASPTPMSFSELFTALQQGVIDAQENPIPTIHKNSFYEVQDYLILTSHMANGFTFQMNADKFNNYTPDTQDAINTAAAAAAKQYNTYVKENEAALLADLEKKGMEIIEVDTALFEEKAKAVAAQFPHLEEWYQKIKEVN